MKFTFFLNCLLLATVIMARNVPTLKLNDDHLNLIKSEKNSADSEETASK